MKYFGMLTVFVVLSVVLNPSSGQGANSCFSTLSTGMKIHVPSVKFAGAFYDVNLDVLLQGPSAETGVWLRLQTITVGNLLSCSNPAVFFQDGPSYTLRIPMLKFNTEALWADLEWVPTSDNQLWLRLGAFGVMSNQVFITSVTGDGNLGGWADAGGKTGLAAGDAICQARAAAAGLGGNFIAWLSDENDDAYCRIHGLAGKKADNCGQPTLPANAGPWVRTDGFPFSGPIGELLDDGKVFVPVATDEYGQPFPEPKWYRTGTRNDGTVEDTIGGPCTNWTSGADVMVAGGVSDFTSFQWTSGASNNCSGDYAGLLCIETGAGPPLPNFALPGKKAFLTSATGTGNLGSWADANGQSGIAAGDEICRSRAAAAGLQNPQNFKAWLSDANIDASSRFTSDGPWVRLDGVVLAENHPDLVDGALNTSISLTETGTYVGYDYVWTGTNHVGGTTPDTCNNWADATQSFNGSTGRTFDRSGWTYSGYPPCDWPLHLYCFED
jgi:hypothetical protein